MGPYYQSRLPTFQLDRAKLDPHILEQAVAAGCVLWQPATVRSLKLGGRGNNLLEVRCGEETRQVRANWVLDASGKAALLARQRNTWRKLDEHPTNSIWVRYQGVKNLDSESLARRFPAYAAALPCPRHVATNHLMGRGWWCWIIPLKDGDVSAGITWDPRLFELPSGPSLTARLTSHLLGHPVGRELFHEATPIPQDTRMYSHLPYYSTEVAGDGWIICGDAAGFMDPLYSQGLDYCSHGIMVAVEIIADDHRGRCTRQQVADFNRRFATSYFRWYRALYQDKYHYLGDMDLMWAAFLLDISTYFIGPARLVYDVGKPEWLYLPYHGKWGAAFAGFMAFYNRRLVHLAKKRWAAGVYGKNNLGRRLLLRQGFSPDWKMLRVLRQGVWQWLKAEAQGLFLPAPKTSHQTTGANAAAVTEPPVSPLQ